MEKYTGIIVFFLLCFGGLAFAQDNNWEKEFTADLLKGKQELNTATHEGLAYTRNEEMILEDAITKAIANEGEGCEIMKIALDLDYNAYYTLKSIYSADGDVGLDQLCMCATEKGLKKPLIITAMREAIDENGDPRFALDEIAQAQCLEDVGLGYTQAQDTPPRIDPPKVPVPVSVSSPQ